MNPVQTMEDDNGARAIIQEVFSAIQGEGTLVGQRQIFVRFHGCNLTCAFCDTPASQGAPPEWCAVERQAGGREMDAVANPLAVPTVLDAVRRLQQDYPHHSISLTGGEPLLRTAYLDALLPALHAEGWRSFLETNGTLAEAFAVLACAPDYVAMDIKLPSASGQAPCWGAHAAFLDAAVARLSPAGERALLERLQVKVVFGENSLAEIPRAAELIAAVHPAIPCILQPLTPHAGGPSAPAVATVLEAQRLAARLLNDVRVIPQTHVLLGQR